MYGLNDGMEKIWPTRGELKIIFARFSTETLIVSFLIVVLTDSTVPLWIMKTALLSAMMLSRTRMVCVAEVS